MPTSPPAPWLAYHHPVVRDLVWALGSPPLLLPPDNAACWPDLAWGEALLAASRDWLAALDAEPAPLLLALQQDQDRRLGRYFESLLAFWLAWPDNPCYRLRARNLPLRQGAATVGELDFVVEEVDSGDIQHWEVAVKFYLGGRAGGDPAHWLGPGGQDRLDRKLQRLRTHQLPLTTRPEAHALLQAYGRPGPRPLCLLKGRLFYPRQLLGQDSAAWSPVQALPAHLRGWWQHPAEFLAMEAGLPERRWLPLPKNHWLTPLPAGPCRGLAGILEKCAK